MKKNFDLKKANTKSLKEKNDYRLLSRRATAFERFAGEFADTTVFYQNVGGFVRPVSTI